jgi:hypothetical protein
VADKSNNDSAFSWWCALYGGALFYDGDSWDLNLFSSAYAKNTMVNLRKNCGANYC